MNIAGVDLSLTAAGISDKQGADVLTPPKDVWAVKPPRPRHAEMARLQWILEAVHQRTWIADLVLVEGYSFGSASSQTRATGELGGVIRLNWYNHGTCYIDVPPASLKKFATGKGNATKDDMVATAARLGCPVNDNNAVDAWWLRQMGLYCYDTSNPDLVAARTAYRDNACTGVDWPEHILGAA